MNRAAVLRSIVSLTIIEIVAFCVWPFAATRLGRWLAVESRNLPAAHQVDAIIVLGGNSLDPMVMGVDFTTSTSDSASAYRINPLKNNGAFNQSIAARDYALNAGVSDEISRFSRQLVHLMMQNKS